ncbi:MAG: quinone-dependent dihydroorotate dehydrogenase [Myxococcales bacterium]|nr:quinone-dependent dihydroorotate dehydrogenase [Myxococcales bacterium]
MLDAVYRRLLRPALFALDPELAHGASALALSPLQRHGALRRAVAPLFAPPADPRLGVQFLGRSLPNPFGVAAGFDKRCTLYNALGALGFAAVEVGTVTAHGQAGNPRPRLFRVPRDGALINRMGFNNPGCFAAEGALASARAEGVLLGVNLGKSKITALDDAASDYAVSAERLARFADYLVVNVSSPNTPGLRSLQSVDALGAIVAAVRRAVGREGPAVFVKLAPDLDDEALDTVVDFALAEGLGGLVATNTTLSREGLRTPPETVKAMGEGGLSGRPLRARANAVMRRLRRRAGPGLPIVGVGGIFSADDAWERLAAGATWLQVYTGFIYSGPTMVRGLCEALLRRLEAEGVESLAALTAGALDAGAKLPPRSG